MPIRKSTTLKTEENSETKHCPYCDNEIKAKAIKCQYCWEFLEKTQTDNHATKSNIKNKEYTNPQKWSLINGRSFKSIFKCEWRMNRWEYWFYSLAAYVGYFWLCILIWAIIWIVNDGYISDSTSMVVAYWLFIPVVIWLIMVWICRLHDLWKKWPLIILWIIPIANIIIWIMLWFSKWIEWENEFWEEPKSVSKTINTISVIMGILIVIFMVWAES